jgi:hypothetical protein
MGEARRRRSSYRTRDDNYREEVRMPWIIGGGVLYVVLLVTLGLMTLRNGHWVMFIVGFAFPLLWLIGAVMRPVIRLV